MVPVDMDFSRNSLTDRLKRSWDVTKQVFHVMMHDKEILLFPLLSTLLSLFLMAILIFPFIVTVIISGAVEPGASPILFYFYVFLFYLIFSFTTVFFNAGIVYIAKTRMEGGDATFMDGIRAAFSRIGKLFAWAMISASVGLILNILSNKAQKRGGVSGGIGQIVVSIIGMAWAIITVFVVPAIVIKGDGPFQAIKSSVQTMKKTWGESLVQWLGLGTVSGIIGFIISLLFLAPSLFFLFLDAIPAGLIFGGLWVLFMSIKSIIFKAADTVFDTALFLYATTGKEPVLFKKGTLKNAFAKG